MLSFLFFNSDKDDKALGIIGECFKDREVVGIDSTDIIWGLGELSLFESAGAVNMIFSLRKLCSAAALRLEKTLQFRDPEI